MSPEEAPFYVCKRIHDVADDDVILNSTMDECSSCLSIVWTTPADRVVASDRGAVPLCVQCERASRPLPPPPTQRLSLPPRRTYSDEDLCLVCKQPRSSCTH